MTNRPLRLVVAGLGAVAQSVHLPLVIRRPDLFTLVGLVDLSPGLTDAIGARYGIPADGRGTDLESVLDAVAPDALLIAAGGSHRAATVAGLRRGLAVLCEKPLAFTQAELDAIGEALPAERERLMVGYMKQYDPAVERAREILAEVDDIRTVDVDVLHPTGYSQLEFAHILGATDVPPHRVAELRAEDDRLRLQALGDVGDPLWRVYSGALLSSLAHDLSILRFLTGPPATVELADVWRRAPAQQVHVTGRDTPALGVQPPSIRVAGRLGDQARYLLNWHYLHDYPAYRETVRIVWGAGSLELQFPSPYLLHAPTVLTLYRPRGDDTERVEFRSTAEAFERQLEAFVDMACNGTPPRTGFAGASDDLRVCQEIVRRHLAATGVPAEGELRQFAP
jgi:myo-inositol 2-dehydrogenase/D-chiro-inositol 1-dehydrogenase